MPAHLPSLGACHISSNRSKKPHRNLSCTFSRSLQSLFFCFPTAILRRTTTLKTCLLYNIRWCCFQRYTRQLTEVDSSYVGPRERPENRVFLQLVDFLATCQAVARKREMGLRRPFAHIPSWSRWQASRKKQHQIHFIEICFTLHHNISHILAHTSMLDNQSNYVGPREGPENRAFQKIIKSLQQSNLDFPLLRYDFLKKSITAPNICTIQFAPHLLDNRICSTIDFPKIDFTHNRICSTIDFPKIDFTPQSNLLHNPICKKIVSQFSYIFRTIWRSAQYYKQTRVPRMHTNTNLHTFSKTPKQISIFFRAHSLEAIPTRMQKTASKSLLQFSRSGTVPEEHFCLLLAETRGKCLLYNFASLN